MKFLAFIQKKEFLSFHFVFLIKIPYKIHCAILFFINIHARSFLALFFNCFFLIKDNLV